MAVISYRVDDDDEAAIRDAIAAYQRGSHQANGETLVSDGDSDLGGAVLAEICRGWLERHEAGEEDET